MQSTNEVIATGNLYHVVIHDRENKYTMDQIETFVNEKLLSSYYMICQEKEESNKHYHLMVETNVSQTDSQNRPIRKLLNEFGVSGKGNLSTSKVKDKKQMMKYLLKDDGELRTRNVPESDINLFRKLSYKKGDFNKSKQLLEEQFMSDPSMSIYQFTDNFVNLKIDYHQNLNGARIKDYALLILFRRDRSIVSTWVDSLLCNEPIPNREGRDFGRHGIW